MMDVLLRVKVWVQVDGKPHTFKNELSVYERTIQMPFAPQPEVGIIIDSDDEKKRLMLGQGKGDLLKLFFDVTKSMYVIEQFGDSGVWTEEILTHHGFKEVKRA